MSEFKIGDWVYAHDWCYGQIVELTDTEARLEFSTETGGGSFTFELSDLKRAPAPEPERTILVRDRLLITAGARAASMYDKDFITLPGEDKLVEFIVDAVRTYIKLPDDIPFDYFIDEALYNEFGKERK